MTSKMNDSEKSEAISMSSYGDESTSESNAVLRTKLTFLFLIMQRYHHPNSFIVN